MLSVVFLSLLLSLSLFLLSFLFFKFVSFKVYRRERQERDSPGKWTYKSPVLGENQRNFSIFFALKILSLFSYVTSGDL